MKPHKQKKIGPALLYLHTKVIATTQQFVQLLICLALKYFLKLEITKTYLVCIHEYFIPAYDYFGAKRRVQLDELY